MTEQYRQSGINVVTGTLGSFALGNIPFGDASGSLTQSSDINWNDTTKQLSINGGITDASDITSGTVSANTLRSVGGTWQINQDAVALSFITFKGPASVPTPYQLTFPGLAPSTEGSAMVTNASGDYNWVNVALVPSSGAPVTVTTSVGVGERLRYDPSGGTFSIVAPASPISGDMIAIKNESTSATAITMNGNGNNIEGLATFTPAATVPISGDGVAVTWQYNGTEWIRI